MKKLIFSVLMTGTLCGVAATRYVSLSGSNTYPYESLSTAANTIQTAIDQSSTGDTILVARGVYKVGTKTTPGGSSLNRVVVDNLLTVRSLDKHAAVIEGASGDTPVRCVYVYQGGVLEDFVLRNGHAVASGDEFLDQSGGGVNLQMGTVAGCKIENCSAKRGGGVNSAAGLFLSYGGVFEDCVITNCFATFHGGGAYQSKLENCRLLNNESDFQGGGASWKCILTNCVISGNTSGSDGGGLYDCTATDCLIADNYADTGGLGGGSYYGSLTRCRIVDNYAYESGGTHGADLDQCEVIGNRAYNSFSGSYGGTISRSLFRGNSAQNPGIYTGEAIGYADVLNCIVVDNDSGCLNCDLVHCTVARNDGVGVQGGTLYNCIVVDNATADIRSVDSVSQVCSPDAAHGMWGSITNAPLFDAMSFRLREDSPCIDIGVEHPDPTVDYDGHPRILDGDGEETPAERPDLGAFEFCSREGDHDSDGLSDYEEAWVYHSDLSDDDTDNDGRTDGDEVDSGLCPTLNDAAAIALGESHVTADPASFGLYSELLLRSEYPDSVLAKVEGGDAVVSLRLQTTSDLTGNSWTNVGVEKSWVIDAEAGASFYRVGSQ